MRRHWPVVAIVIVAALVRLWGIHFGLPYLNARPDEGTIVSVAGGLHNDLNPHFFNYPALFMTVVAALLWPLHVGDTTTPYLVARYLSAGAGIASVVILYRIGDRLFGRTVGLLAAALLAVAFLHVRDSHFGVTDVPMTFLALVAFWFIVRVFESAVSRNVLLAGAASGFATSTKYTAALIALPALAAIFLSTRSEPTLLQHRVRHAALFACTMAGAFVLGSPFSILDFREFMADVTFEARHLAEGHKVMLGRGWVHHVTSSLRYGLGLPLLVTGIAGMLLLAIRERRTGALVAIFPLSYYLVVGRGYTVFARYIIPVIPFLCLTAAYAVSEAATWMSAHTGRRYLKPAVILMSVVCLAWPSVQSVIRFNRLMARPDSRALARAWLETHIPSGSTIAQLGMGNGNVLLFEGDASEAEYTKVTLARPGVRPDVIIVNSSPLDVQNTLSARELRILSRDYNAAVAFNGLAGSDAANVYDWQDDFFLPLSGFKGIERPGPNVTIYVLRRTSRSPRVP